MCLCKKESLRASWARIGRLLSAYQRRRSFFFTKHWRETPEVLAPALSSAKETWTYWRVSSEG